MVPRKQKYILAAYDKIDMLSGETLLKIWIRSCHLPATGVMRLILQKSICVFRLFVLGILIVYLGIILIQYFSHDGIFSTKEFDLKILTPLP